MFATGTDRGVCRDKTSSACFHPRSPLSITILFSDKEKQDDNDDHDDGYPAHSHHDKIPLLWVNVSNDKDGKMSVTKSHHT